MHTADCRSVAYSPTGEYITSTSFDGSVAIYDTKEDKIKSRIKSHTDK